MKSNLIIMGTCSNSQIASRISQFNVHYQDVYCSDGMVAFAQNYVFSHPVNDLTSFLDMDTRSSLSQDTDELEFLYDQIFGYDDDVVNGTKFIFGFNIIEIVRLMRFLRRSRENNFVLLHPKMYEVLTAIYGAAELSKLATFIVHKPSLATCLYFILLYRKITMYGRFGYLKYFVALPLFLFGLRTKNSVGTDSEVIFNDNEYTEKVCNKLFSTVRTESYERLLPLKWTEMAKTYWRDVKRNKIKIDRQPILNNFLQSNFGMKSMFIYLYAPFMEYYKTMIKKFFQKNHNVKALVQSTDCSPHRYLWAQIANNFDIRTIVTQHGEISEPLIITSIVSNEAVLSTKATYDLYKANKMNQDKIVSFLESDSDEVEPKKAKDTRKNVYIFTTSYSGYGYDASLIFNHKMIKSVLKILDGREANVIVKIHPSEKKSLYSNVFKNITISNSQINQIIGEIDLAVCGPSTSYGELIRNGIPTFYFEEGLQRKHGFPQTNYLELLEKV